jgi:hypothetical protein
MDSRKVVLLVLVLVAIVAFMALGAGAYRDSRDGTALPDTTVSQNSAMQSLHRATGWMRSRLKRERVQSPCWKAAGFQFVGDCGVTIGKGSLLPSRFTLAVATGAVQLCFAFDPEKLRKCGEGDGDPKIQALDGEKEFTVARDPAYLLFRCVAVAGTSCLVRLD